MTYVVNRSDGTLVANVPDNVVDTTSTSITLVGRNFSGYGEIIAEDFVVMLENFNNSVQPGGGLLSGQLWFDNVGAEGVLKVRNKANTDWIPISGVTASATAPTNPLDGDLWWNSTLKIMFAYDGTAGRWVQLNPRSQTGELTGLVHLIMTTDPSAGGAISGYAAIPTGGTTNDVIGITANGNLTGFLASAQVAFSTDIFFHDVHDEATPGSATFRYFSFDGSGADPFGGIVEKGFNTGLNAGATDHWFNGKAKVAALADAVTGLPSAANIMSNATDSAGEATRDPAAAPGTNLDFGDAVNVWGTFFGTATSAQYADLAERYETDTLLKAGDLVSIGGSKEVTLTTSENDTEVFGVVSATPAFKMNEGAGDDTTHPFIALSGRVHCYVVGTVVKGQRLVSSDLPGVAKGYELNTPDFSIFGRALENKDDDNVGIIEVVVGVK